MPSVTKTRVRRRGGKGSAARYAQHRWRHGVVSAPRLPSPEPRPAFRRRDQTRPPRPATPPTLDHPVQNRALVSDDDTLDAQTRVENVRTRSPGGVRHLTQEVVTTDFWSYSKIQVVPPALYRH